MDEHLGGQGRGGPDGRAARPRTRVWRRRPRALAPEVDIPNGIRLPEYFPELTLKRVPEVGHFMMRENPARVGEEVLAFFAPLR
jgi:pimeloyl-ACP methyl ester carboxylesterase